MAHANINPFVTYVRSQYLYEQKEGFGYFSDATIFAITSYPNKPLYFEIMLDGSSCSSVPINALTDSKESYENAIDSCMYFNCPDENISITIFDYLAEVNDCYVWKKDNTAWQKANYVFTVTWHNSQTFLHLLALEDGNYIAWPNEKITWGSDPPEKLPLFKDAFQIIKT